MRSFGLHCHHQSSFRERFLKPRAVHTDLRGKASGALRCTWLSVTLLAATLLAATLSGCRREDPAGSGTPQGSEATARESTAASSPTKASNEPAASPASVVTAATGSFTVRWKTIPHPIPVSDPFVIECELFVDSACTTPLEGGVLSVDAQMPHHGHGMNVKPKVEATGPGRYRVKGVLFHMPGRWELMFDRTDNGLLERAQTTVEIE